MIFNHMSLKVVKLLSTQSFLSYKIMYRYFIRFKDRCCQRQASKGRVRSKIVILLYFLIREIITQKLISYNKILLILVLFSFKGQ